ncbi:acetolactate decarboxylase [Sphingobacterium sp. Ag1]|nr:acetolactate decarboxylase [Sphingobacterium sp. Ag1]
MNKLIAEAHPHNNVLYNYGVIDGFIGGLYKGSLAVKDMKLKGDFGLGAPDMLDGELTVLNGVAYQTKSTGETVVLDNDHKSSFASVTFFKADTTFIIADSMQQKEILEIIENKLANKNGMYAIRVSGDFGIVRTRAFPAVKEEPFPLLSNILDRQKFFDIRNTGGTLVGYHLPEYLNGIQISGFHFHYLSSSSQQGGHVLDFKGQNFKIEIAELGRIELDIPKDKDFQSFKFKARNNEALKQVEQGK